MKVLKRCHIRIYLYKAKWHFLSAPTREVFFCHSIYYILSLQYLFSSIIIPSPKEQTNITTSSSSSEPLWSKNWPARNKQEIWKKNSVCFRIKFPCAVKLGRLQNFRELPHLVGSPNEAKTENNGRDFNLTTWNRDLRKFYLKTFKPTQYLVSGSSNSIDYDFPVEGYEEENKRQDISLLPQIGQFFFILFFNTYFY